VEPFLIAEQRKNPTQVIFEDETVALFNFSLSTLFFLMSFSFLNSYSGSKAHFNTEYPN
jgi:hypothetical protein